MDNYTAKMLAKGKNSATKKGCKKAGRNLKKCGYYKAARYFKNKLAGLERHLQVHSNDACAIEAKARLFQSVTYAP
jgi:hypothetical protein